MSVEKLQTILDRELEVRRHQRVFVGAFLLAIAIVIAAVASV